MPADPWGGFVERVTRHHGMTRDEAWMLAQALGGDDVPAAMLACLEAAEAAGRSARADLMAHHPDAPKAEDPAGGLVREPVQTDWVETQTGDRRGELTPEMVKQWQAEMFGNGSPISQRRIALLTGIPVGTLQPWLAGHRPLALEHQARLRVLMLAKAA